MIIKTKKIITEKSEPEDAEPKRKSTSSKDDSESTTSLLKVRGVPIKQFSVDR